jgi:hypothetical protein
VSGDARYRRFAPFALATALLVAYFLLATSAAATKSNTFDEIAHVTAGFAYWTLDDYRFQPENGNFPQRLAALPAVLAGATFPSLDDPNWRRSDVYAFGRTFFFESGNDIDRLLALGRGAITLLGVLLGAIVFVWSYRLNGIEGGLISLALFALCPTVLAHGAQTTSDMAAALAFTASTGALWALSRRVTALRLGASCLAAATLFLSKFSAPVLALVALVFVLIRLFSFRPLEVEIWRWHREIAGRGARALAFVALGLVHAIFIWSPIWASYGFRYDAFHEPARPGEQLLVDWTLVLSAPDGTTRSTIGTAIDWAREHRLLPESYLYGFAHTVKFAQSRRAFMDGEHSLTGWASFFPYAFSIKTPLPVLLLVMLGLAGMLARRERFGDAMPLFVFLAVYWTFAIATNLNIGHRHLLPVYPALFILAGGAGTWIKRAFSAPAALARPAEVSRGKRKAQGTKKVITTGPSVSMRVAAVATAVLIAWQGIESFAVRPHYLAYFNQLAGGPAHGYQRLVDSSLDWGQDLPALKMWLDEHAPAGPSRPPVYLSYFGTSTPAHARIDATILESYLALPRETSVDLKPGYYCISATMLQGVYLAVNGAWTAKSEETYRMMSPLAAARSAAQTEEERSRLEAAAGNRRPEFWNSALRLHDELRTARLMAYLRRRQPDANAGYSILIYRLTQADLDAALRGPAPY